MFTSCGLPSKLHANATAQDISWCCALDHAAGGKARLEQQVGARQGWFWAGDRYAVEKRWVGTWSADRDTRKGDQGELLVIGAKRYLTQAELYYPYE